MNTYQVDQNNNNIINQNKDIQNINYIYNRCNQNIDHLRDNFNDKQIEPFPYKNRNNIRNSSKDMSSILNNAQYENYQKNIPNNRFNSKNYPSDNSLNNYHSINHPSFGNIPNINNGNFEINRPPINYNINNNMDINPQNNIYSRNSFQSEPIPYPNNRPMNSMNIVNNNLNGSEVINFNGINYNIGSKFNNKNSFENNFRRSNYSQKSENLNIGNNVFNINLSSITSQDIFKSYEIQKKQDEKKKKKNI